MPNLHLDSKRPLDRRKLQRFPAPLVRVKLASGTPVEVKDLSLTGVAVEGLARFQPKDRVRLHLQHEGGEIRLAGVVQWCRLSGTKRLQRGEVLPWYRAGISFQTAFGDQMEELFKLLNETAFLAASCAVVSDRES
jgi:hypothetical protein